MQTITYQLDGRNVVIPSGYTHLVTMKHRKDIYQEFDIEPWTFRRRMKEYGIELPEKGILNIESVLRVYLALGWPPKMCHNGKM